MESFFSHSDEMIDRIVIKGNTREFLMQYGIECCFSTGKQMHLNYCRSYFDSLRSSSHHNKQQQQQQLLGVGDSVLKDGNIMLIDDDIQNLKIAYEHGHFVFQVSTCTSLVDFYHYLKDKIVELS